MRPSLVTTLGGKLSTSFAAGPFVRLRLELRLAGSMSSWTTTRR